MKIAIEVVAMKAFKGVIDGKSIDSGTLYARIKMDGSKNAVTPTEVNFKAGEATEEWRMPSSDFVTRMKHLSCPFTAVLEVERMSNGRETKEVVTDVVPQSVEVSPVRKVA